MRYQAKLLTLSPQIVLKQSYLSILVNDECLILLNAKEPLLPQDVPPKAWHTLGFDIFFIQDQKAPSFKFLECWWSVRRMPVHGWDR